MTPALEAAGRLVWAAQMISNYPLSPMEIRYHNAHYPGGEFGFERDKHTVWQHVTNQSLERLAAFFAAPKPSMLQTIVNADPRPYKGDDRERYATGGRVKPGPLYVVGERSPEFLTPAKDRTE